MCKGRISSDARPSARSPVSMTMARMAFFSSFLSSAAMSAFQASRSSSVKHSSLTRALSASTLAMRESLSASRRAAPISSRWGATRSAIEGSAACTGHSTGSMAQRSRKRCWASQNALMASWPNVMAASMSSSEISSAPASTMEM